MAEPRKDLGENDVNLLDVAGEKELLWIEESNQRFYAYNHFGQHPERLVGWFDKYLSGAAKPDRAAKHVAQTA